MIAWCQADEFWRGNILSMPTLRRQYDKLRLAALRERGRVSAEAAHEPRGFAGIREFLSVQEQPSDPPDDEDVEFGYDHDTEDDA